MTVKSSNGCHSFSTCSTLAERKRRRAASAAREATKKQRHAWEEYARAAGCYIDAHGVVQAPAFAGLNYAPDAGTLQLTPIKRITSDVDTVGAPASKKRSRSPSHAIRSMASASPMKKSAAAPKSKEKVPMHLLLEEFDRAVELLCERSPEGRCQAGKLFKAYQQQISSAGRSPGTLTLGSTEFYQCGRQRFETKQYSGATMYVSVSLKAEYDSSDVKTTMS